MISLRQVHRSREMLHTERVKAIEAGLPWQESATESASIKFMNNAFWIAFWMLVIGCGGSFSAVASAMDNPVFEERYIAFFAWLCAAGASIASVICALILMIKSRAPASLAEPESRPSQ